MTSLSPVQRGRETALAVAIGVATFSTSLIRVLLTNPQTITDTVWAEDGLFPLCLVDFPLLSCTFEPYAGYLNLAPRVLAIPVAILPLEFWPVAIACISSAALAAIATFVYVLLRQRSATIPTAIFCALVPVLLPTVGFEVIATNASISWALTYAGAIALVTPWTSKVGTYLTACVVFLASSSTPLALALIPLAIINFYRQSGLNKGPKFIIGALMTGLALQLLTILRARQISTADRDISFSNEFGEKYLSGFRTVLLDIAGISPSSGNSSFGSGTEVLFLVLLVAIVGALIYLVRRRNFWLHASGLLGLTALLILCFVGFTSYANNRYLLLPTALLAASLTLTLNSLRGLARSILSIGVPILLLMLWLPQFPASGFRTGNSNGWAKELSNLSNECAGDTQKTVSVELTPYWFVGYSYSGAGPIIECPTLRQHSNSGNSIS